MRFKDFLQEDAAAGSVGSGSIAANPSGDSRREHKHSERDWRADAAARREDRAEQAAKHAKQEEYHAKAKEKLKDLKDKKKKKGFAGFLQRRRLGEDFDMSDIVSRLKAADTETTGVDSGVVSYGVEDDKGNSMRVTVPADQAKDFEETLAKRLADNKSNTSNGINLKGNSLAEILYDMREKFNIISVDFPTIPDDVVYNADLASKAPASDTIDDSGEFESGFDDFGNQADFDQGGDDMGMGDMGDMGGDLGGDEGLDLDQGQQDDLTGQNGGQGGETGDVNANMGGEEGGNPEDMEGENVMDFGEEPAAPEDEGSILTQIVSMLKAQANAEEAKADAAAEEARAKQAEWSAIAAEKEVKRQEELARVDAEMQSQKKKEKEAKKYAELARYNVERANRSGMGESRTSYLSDIVQLLKEDQFDNAQTLQKQKLQLPQKYQILPTDDQETQNWKRMMIQFETKELDARIDAVNATNALKAAEAKKQQDSQDQQQNSNNSANQNNPTGSQQPNTPQVPTGNGNQAGQ